MPARGESPVAASVMRLVNLWFNPIDGCIDGGVVPPVDR
jgi:hypothetical protein